MSNIDDEIKYIKKELSHYKLGWGWKVAKLISEVPKGELITYGTLAKWANKRFNLKINARNISNVRRKMYRLLRDKYSIFKLPLHRVIKKGDYFGEYDSPKTRKESKEKRIREKSWNSNPTIFKPNV